MLIVADARCVSTPPASEARIVIVRPEPARSAMVPDATWLTIGILNNCDGMSGAVTSTTTVATAVPVRSAVTMSFDSAGGPTAPSCEQATTAARAKERTRNRVWDMVPYGGKFRTRRAPPVLQGEGRGLDAHR